jgi:hypothetical protein
MFENFISSQVTVVLMSIVWGLGLSTLFHRTCVGNNCKVIQYQGPPLSDDQYYWTYGTEQCYRLNPYVVNCK